MNVNDVIKALTAKLNAKYPDSKVSNKEIKSPDRPCAYIKFINTKPARIAESYTQEKIALDIIYFAESSKKGYADLLKKQKELKALFLKPLKVLDRYLEISDLEFNLNEDDYVLNTLINIDIGEYTEIGSVEDDDSVEFDPVNAGCLYDMENIEIGG